MKKILILSISVLLAVSCTNDFEGINTNTNAPTDVNPENLLPTVIFNIANNNVGTAYNFGEVTAQYGARYEYISLDLYNWTSDDSFWYYIWLQNTNDLKKKAETLNNPNYKAIALILETFMVSIMTDAYGPVPYSEANRGAENIVYPKYDSQESIYNQLFENLEQINTLISDATVKGDIMFGGNMSKWRKFANTLYVRLLMRVSNKIDVSNKLNQIVNNPGNYPLIASNSDNAIYHYSGSFPNISPVTDGYGREYEYHIVVPSTKILNQLMSTNDTRIDAWFEPKDNVAGNWVGLEPGLPIDQIGEPTDYARRKDDFFYVKNKINSIFITYAELNFLLAEARQRNIISQNTAEYYYNLGVTASFEQWGSTMPADFLTTSSPYSVDNLYIQKWLALYHTSAEAWFDWKRTGKPDFIDAGPGTQNNGLVPRRLIYPDMEQSLNAQQYNQAVQSIGGDNINRKIWWDNF